MRILVDGRLWNHPKLLRFAELLGRNPTEAGGYLARLWSWCAEYRLSGSLEGLTDRETSSAAGWLGAPSKFVKALRDARWVLDTQVHDWQEHQGKYIERMLKERERKRRGSSTEAPREKAPPVSGSGSVAVAGTDAGSVSKKKEDAPAARARALVGKAIDLWNHGRAAGAWIRPTRQRETKALARLHDGFTEEQLITVLKALKESEWHQGGNDRNWRAPGPEWVWSSQERVEQWLAKASSPVPTPKGGSRVAGPAHVGRFALRPGQLEDAVRERIAARDGLAEGEGTNGHA